MLDKMLGMQTCSKARGAYPSTIQIEPCAIQDLFHPLRRAQTPEILPF